MFTAQSPRGTFLPTTTIFDTLKIGAGGFITGIDMTSDGSKVIRTDTYGAYYGSGNNPTWKQIVTTVSMPGGTGGNTGQGSDLYVGLSTGVYEIRIAPSNTSRFYMAFNGFVYRSDDRGGTWTRTSLAQFNGPANDGNRNMGQFMAIDPNNADIVYMGTNDAGVSVTSDGGTTWNTVSGITNTASGKNLLIAFDTNSTFTHGQTQGIYISSYGTGVYHSVNGGGSWTLTTGTPTTHTRMICDQTGTVWLSDFSGVLHKYTGTWSTIAGAGVSFSVAVDPANSAHLVSTGFAGNTASDGVKISIDTGANWFVPSSVTTTSSDIPWISWYETNNPSTNYLSASNVLYDPAQSNVLYISAGLGVWTTSPPTSSAALTWSSKSAAIEQLVANWIVSPPGGKPIVAVWDQGVFRVSDPTAYPSTHGIQPLFGASWQVDYASTSPTTIVALTALGGNVGDQSGKSIDGGVTWTQFTGTQGVVNQGGCIAASTPTNYVLVRTDSGASANQPYYTTDGGATWNAISISGVPTSGETGWGFAYYIQRRILAADRVDANTFYLVNYGPSGSPSAAGCYKSTNSGVSWSHVYTGTSLGGVFPHLKSVPYNSGHLFYCLGVNASPAITHPTADQFFRSTDHGATWNPVANVKEVWAFGFGCPKPGGGGYPTIFIYGWVNGVIGIWRSDDNASTWTRISDGFPINSFDEVSCLEGDMNTYGTVYVGFHGSGFAYGSLH